MYAVVWKEGNLVIWLGTIGVQKGKLSGTVGAQSVHSWGTVGA